MRKGWLVICMASLVLFCPVPGSSADSDTDLWKAIRSGQVFVLLRHAIAPGTGDPGQFVLGDCSTQRNLSAVGRRQAQAIGEQFRSYGIKQAQVFSSQWCRCLETAALLGLGPVEQLVELNSFFQRYERRDNQTQKLTQWLETVSFNQPNQPLVLVTHQVNITALTGFYPESGELVVVNRSDFGELSVLGSIKTD